MASDPGLLLFLPTRGVEATRHWPLTLFPVGKKWRQRVSVFEQIRSSKRRASIDRPFQRRLGPWSRLKWNIIQLDLVILACCCHSKAANYFLKSFGWRRVGWHFDTRQIRIQIEGFLPGD